MFLAYFSPSLSSVSSAVYGQFIHDFCINPGPVQHSSWDTVQLWKLACSNIILVIFMDFMAFGGMSKFD